jgi:hypothetical protein
VEKEKKKRKKKDVSSNADQPAELQNKPETAKHQIQCICYVFHAFYNTHSTPMPGATMPVDNAKHNEQRGQCHWHNARAIDEKLHESRSQCHQMPVSANASVHQ